MGWVGKINFVKPRKKGDTKEGRGFQKGGPGKKREKSQLKRGSGGVLGKGGKEGVAKKSVQ